ncbi:PREDICTED: uncharacterized protein LOC106816564 [Priapulus caudatus]|uniref:Uncharacterized protein LOC106816564 n=1 Tax=Priapulus caudatus TaxID=37621 RepID=A0ABM1EWV3_PRICU|nr:PREDICTED: uncharacterized protein LOC106816564 [Priapulus caudatus]
MRLLAYTAAALFIVAATMTTMRVSAKGTCIGGQPEGDQWPERFGASCFDCECMSGGSSAGSQLYTQCFTTPCVDVPQTCPPIPGGHPVGTAWVEAEYAGDLCMHCSCEPSTGPSTYPHSICAMGECANPGPQ